MKIDDLGKLDEGAVADWFLRKGFGTDKAGAAAHSRHQRKIGQSQVETRFKETLVRSFAKAAQSGLIEIPAPAAQAAPTAQAATTAPTTAKTRAPSAPRARTSAAAKAGASAFSNMSNTLQAGPNVQSNNAMSNMASQLVKESLTDYTKFDALLESVIKENVGMSPGEWLIKFLTQQAIGQYRVDITEFKAQLHKLGQDLNGSLAAAAANMPDKKKVKIDNKTIDRIYDFFESAVAAAPGYNEYAQNSRSDSGASANPAVVSQQVDNLKATFAKVADSVGTNPNATLALAKALAGVAYSEPQIFKQIFGDSALAYAIDKQAKQDAAKKSNQTP
jgi:hypothetical protein